MTKITWIIQAPINIYVMMAKHLTSRFPDIDLIFIMSQKFHYKADYIRNETGCKVKILPESYSFLEILSLPYYIMRYVNISQRVGKPDYILLKGLKKYLKKISPDLIITNLYAQPYTWQASKYCAKYKVPLILTTQTMNFSTDFFSRFIEKMIVLFSRRIFRQAKYILSWSEDALKFARINFKTKNRLKIIPLYAGINLEIFHKIKTYNSDRKDKILKLLVVGRFVSYKNHITLFKGVKYLKDIKKIEVSLSILGSGELKLKLIQEIKKLGIEKEVEFLPKTPYKDMKNIYCSHDILILPSYKEPIGMVVPEALACGTPVIVSNGCGAKLYVENGKNGYIFDPFNYRDLAKKILYLYDNEKRRQFGNYGEKLIRKRYNINDIINDFYKIILNNL
ncbi:MAG: glycosyltransferase family 4 protein [Promethearchaeota archaeon]